MYDYCIVGAGIYGATFARLATDAGKKCLVIDKRSHIAGNCYDERREGILVNLYGGHIFHTNSKPVWEFVNRFATFSDYVHRVKVSYHGNLYSFPINLQTFKQVWGLDSVEEVKARLERERIHRPQPNFFEDYVLDQVGLELYNIFFKGYTEKQWNRSPEDLPASIARRIPIRLTDDDRYFSDKFQGMPVDGYTAMVERMLDGIEVRLGEELGGWWDRSWFTKVVYSGPLDALFDYRYGPLEYRSLGFSHEVMDGDFQGCATVNYTQVEVPYTRIIEWKHFRPEESHAQTVITREFPRTTGEPYYPINDEKNNLAYRQYKSLVPDWMIVGGRLGSYQYLNMDQAIAQAMKDARRDLG